MENDMDQNLLKKYAEFTVKIAIGIKKGQTLIIKSPIEAAYFARMCAEVAFEAGARDAVVHYNDELLSRIKMEHCEKEVIEDIKPHIERMMLDYIEAEGGAAVLSISARNPEIYKGLDQSKLQASAIAMEKAMKTFYKHMLGGDLQWTIAAVPSESWNHKVFPELSSDEAREAMWDAIFTCTRMKGGNPEQEWIDFIRKTKERIQILNDHNFSAIRMTANNGTDLTVGLAKNHRWEGGASMTSKGDQYIANVPTEEVFTCPDKNRVNGTVYASKPYIYNGDIIENFYFTFQDGLVVDYKAEIGQDLLDSMMTVDEGAKRIGEVAIVDNESGVGKSGILYYNTLFDENAACHIAFGRCYPTTIEGGEGMTQEEVEAHGGNYSVIHEDVMVGTKDMNIVGIKDDNTEILLVKEGFWII